LATERTRPPVVMVRGAQGPTPLLLLLEGGLGAALVFDGRIGSLGGPREHFEVDCPECPAGFVLHAGQLKAAMQQWPKRTPCVVLTRAVAAHR
jgi:hypothetical protein